MTNHKHKLTPPTEVPTKPAPDLDVADWPQPVVFLNYPGYHLNQVGQIRGPMLQHDGQDQLLTVVSESYDATTHTTRNGLTYGIITKRVPA